jgi:hypothetical protein
MGAGDGYAAAAGVDPLGAAAEVDARETSLDNGFF